jgi:WD40 repeat protein
MNNYLYPPMCHHPSIRYHSSNEYPSSPNWNHPISGNNPWNNTSCWERPSVVRPSNAFVRQQPIPPEVLTLSGHDGYVSSIAYSPDGNLLLSGDLSGTVKLWNIRTRVAKNEPSRGRGGVKSVAFSPHGDVVAFGYSNGEVRIQTVETWSEIETIPGSIVAFSPDGRDLATGSIEGLLRVYDVSTGTLIMSIQTGSEIESLAYSPDGTMLASGGGYTGLIEIWDTASGNRITSLMTTIETYGLPPENDNVHSVAFSPDGNRFAYGGGKGFRLWNIKNWSVINGENSFAEQRIAFSPPAIRQLALSGLMESVISLRNASTGVWIRSIFPTNRLGVMSIAYSPDGIHLAAGLMNEISIYRV